MTNTYASSNNRNPGTSMQGLLTFARGASHNFVTRSGDWFLAWTLTMVGFSLLVHPDQFAELPSFRLLAKLAPQEVWAWTALTVGTIRITALLINGTYQSFRWSPLIRAMLSAFSAILWFQLALVAFDGERLTPQDIVYMTLFLRDSYNALLAASEAGVAETVWKNERGARSR